MAANRSLQLTGELIDAVVELNRRWSRRSLAVWRGQGLDGQPDEIYAGYETLLTPAGITRTESIETPQTRRRIRHGLIDHYLQRELMPHETEMQSWSRGAAAHVDGEKISFREVIPWCQKASTLAKRQKLQQETGPLCKLLKPFALNYWQIVLEKLTGELGFDSYMDYCSRKKGIDYGRLVELAKKLLAQTDNLYFTAMEAWSRERFGRPLDGLSRFDAIYLFSLRPWDRFFPLDSAARSLDLFQDWGIDPEQLPGLHLDIGPSADKSAQAITLMVSTPHEVHILMRPEGGWIDLETLWHELGHGLSAVHTDPGMGVVERELATGFSLSEAYAFFLQRLALSRPVLDTVMALADETIGTIQYYRELRDLAVFRRYAAKLIAEVEMFASGRLSDGRPYAETMARYTGFYHQPESHLFDLVPELYCADYLLGWLGEANLEGQLTGQFGAQDWLTAEAGRWVKGLWYQGNTMLIDAFFRDNQLGRLDGGLLLERWSKLG